MKEKILVVIPYADEDEEEIKTLKKVYEKRAAIPCVVETIKDEERIGWVSMHNKRASREDYDYYVYSCADYYPGRGYLKRAYDTLKKHGVGMVGFNDGKWDGKNATVGLLKKDYLKSNYATKTLFHAGYKKHGADPDLTELSILKREYRYCPEAILMEIDPQKEINGLNNNPDDVKLFLQRRATGFPK